MPDESLRYPLPGGVLPDPIEIFQDTFKEFSDDPMPYILAGLGQIIVVFPVVIMMIFGIYIGVFGMFFGGMVVGGIAGALASEMAGEEVGAMVFMVAYVVTMLLTFLVLIAISAAVGAALAPLNASLVRRVAMHQRGEKTLDFTAAFSDMKENLTRVIGVSFLVSLIVMVGLMMCYLPGIIAMFVLIYASSMVYLHGSSPMNAVKTSFNHFKDNLQFHGMFTLLYFGCAIVANYIPIAGPMFLLSAHVRAHRSLFGDGDEPVIEVTPKELVADPA